MAVSPDLLRYIMLAIIKNRPRIILEAGSGVSTLVMACTIEKKFKLDSKIVSLEHSEKYFNQINNLPQMHGLFNIVSILHSPLSNFKDNDQIIEWYDISDKDIPNQIDLFIIDGPPADENKLSRYPARPILYNKLNDKCIICEMIMKKGLKNVVKKLD